MATLMFEELFHPAGPKAARFQQRTCADGWIIQYTTTRIVDPRGEHNGKFGVITYKPISDTKWDFVSLHSFPLRWWARARAQQLIAEHEEAGGASGERWRRSADRIHAKHEREEKS